MTLFGLATLRSRAIFGLISLTFGGIFISTLLVFGVDSLVTDSSAAKLLFKRDIYLISLIILPLLNISGLLLGIVGICLKHTRKLLPGIGIVLNSVGLIFMAVVWIIILLFVGLLAIVGPVPVR